MKMTVPGSHEIYPTDEIEGASRVSMEDSVSMIILNSFLPRSFKNEDAIPISRSTGFSCGSAAEFCIEPIQTCVGDRDILRYNSDRIAFSGDVPLLPADVRNFDDEIECYRLEPYKKYPGFVRIKYVGEMKYKWNLNKYEFHEAPDETQNFFQMDHEWNMGNCMKAGNKRDMQIKGPAISFICKGMNEDNVYSVNCPQWPTEATDWFYRPRNYGWPTRSNLQMIANLGCHVVYVQHRDCRDDKDQWRFSFSLAEVVLIRSWTQTQQLVYHLLRFFAKKELIQKECPKEKEVLCTYHLKTLMLWTCEQESPEWWNSSVIGLCSKLLQKLSEWLQRRHCPNYFIPGANLFHKELDRYVYSAIRDCIQCLSNPEILNRWFLYNYLLPFCYEKGLMVYEADDHNIKELCRIARIFTFRNKFETLRSFDEHFCLFAIETTFHLNDMDILQEVEHCTHEWKEHLYVARRLPIKSEKSTIDLVEQAFMLRAANAIINKTVFCYKTLLADITMILLCGSTTYWPKNNNFPSNYRTQHDKARVYFLRAQEYMGNMPVSVSDPEFQLLSRLSMEFLRKSVTSKDATSKALRCAAFAYMAVICFATSQYETAVELCSAILLNPKPFGSSRLSSNKRKDFPLTLSAGCLIFIDDVSNIIGYLLLCRHVLDKLLDRYSEINLDLRLTPEVFAQYIMIQSMQRMSQRLQRNWNKIPGEFLMDAFLMTVVKRKLRCIRIEAKRSTRGYRLCIYRRNRSVSELMSHVTGFPLDEDISIRLLMECSLKKVTSIYEDAFEHFCFPFNTLAFCYRVVYHYSCRHYDEVMTLSEQILCEPDIGADLRKCRFQNVTTLPPFSSYFDEEVQCLVGLQTLCFVLFPKHANILCLHYRHDICNIYCNLIKCFKFQCRYLLGRHFLARYLQIRCLMDSNSSVTDILTAFGKLKCRLFLEFIVKKFLWQKLRKTVKQV